MTTLKKSDIINHKITDVIPNIKEDKFDWIEFYGDTALNGNEKVFEQYSENLKRWYKVKVYSTKKYYFSTLFIDITDRKDYEKNLKFSEEKFSKLFKLSPDIIVLIKIENNIGKIVDVNYNFLNLSGYKLDECIGKTISELGLWSNEEERKDFIFRINKDCCIENMLFDIKSKNGKVYNCLISSETIEINNQKHILSVIRNITDQKKIQDKLNNERLKLKTILETIPDLIFLKDIDGIFLACNTKVEKLYGKKEEDIIGKSDFDFVSKDLAEFFRENDKKAIKENKSITNLEWLTFVNDNHKELTQTIKTPMYDYFGNFIGVLGVGRDITEIYKVQQELHDREEIYSSIINQASESIALIDFETAKFVEFNNSACDLLGYTKEEFKNLTVEDIQYKHKLNKIKERFNEIKNKGTVSFETNHKTKNGSILDIFASSTFIKIKDKEYISAIWNDITDRNKIKEEIKRLNQNLEEKVKERTEQLEQANKDLESFAYSVSHDLRAPLRHIDGFSKLLQIAIDTNPEDSYKYIAKIVESSHKMSKMIEDLLKFSRLGRKKLEKTDVDLNILVHQVIDQYKIDIGDRKIEFIVGELPTIQGDYGLLQIVFENLISNAIKFTSKKDFALIEINKCQNCTKGCNIYIKDNGAGFDMAYVDKLFGVFQRLHTESEFAGTGIGLANIKQIVQKHGGTIYANGELDKGATFYLSL